MNTEFAKSPFVSENKRQQPGKSLVLTHASDVRILKLFIK